MAAFIPFPPAPTVSSLTQEAINKIIEARKKLDELRSHVGEDITLSRIEVIDHYLLDAIEALGI